MNALARLLHAIAGWFEFRGSAKDLAARVAKLEAENVQLKTDMTKCKMMVGLNQLMEVTANDE